MQLSTLLLDLYRAAGEQSGGAFEEHALGLVKQALGFESAIWGTGLLHRDGHLTPHVVHLHRQPREALQEWASINVKDPVAAACMANPGSALRFHAPTLFSRPESGVMRDYAKRYGRQSYMVCGMQVDDQPDMMAWLSLYRSDPDAHFSEAERLRYSQLMAHLHQALQINRRLQLQGKLVDEGPTGTLAIADPWGYLHTPPNDTSELLEAEWPGTPRGRLPVALLDVLTGDQNATYRGRTIFVTSRSVGGLLFLCVRRRALLDALSAREHQVAMSVAHGLSAKESGRALGLAPATIRVHLKHIYDKLGLHSQAELAYLLGHARAAPTSPRQTLIREAG